MGTPLKAFKNKRLEDVQQVITPLKIPPSPLLKSLGYGTGVKVFCVERSPKFGKFRSPLAVKKISKSAAANSHNIYQKRLKDEAEILRKLNHPNIIGFRAYNETKDGSDNLVLEYCHTSLGQILEERYENSKGSLEPEKTLKMSIDILKALDYLHNEAKLLHGDLKSYNILVKDDFEICKLCDFGVSLPLDENGFVDNKPYVGTELWSAPEVINNTGTVCSKADIFSFGLVIYETIALIPPHTWNKQNETIDDENPPDLDEKNESISIDLDKSTEYSLGTRPLIPKALLLDSHNIILEIFYLCTNEFPEDRPSAQDLHKALTATLTD